MICLLMWQECFDTHSSLTFDKKAIGFFAHCVPCSKECLRRSKLMAAHGAPWARAANFVKKPPLIFNVTDLELNGFHASILVSWSPPDPKKSQCIDQCIQIHQICVNKHRCDINIKFEVSLHFWPIWPTVCHAWLAWWYTTCFCTLCTWFPTSSQ